jgi:hypothetical protein
LRQRCYDSEGHLIGKRIAAGCALTAFLLGGRPAPPQSSPWRAVTHNITGCYPWLQLTDGSLMFYGYRYIADINGSYVDMAFLRHDPLPSGYFPGAFASAVLPDGRALYEGGECNNADGSGCTTDFTNLGAIYDPVAGSWSWVSPPIGWSTIGGAPSVVLAGGTFMMGRADLSGTRQQALLDATTLSWTATGAGKADANSEEGWTLLPDGGVLVIDVNQRTVPTSSEKYDPTTGSWTSAGTTAVQLADSYEIGPQVLRLDGTVIVFGATSSGAVDHTAIYNTATGVWTAGPDLPTINGQNYTMVDAPAAVLPNGNVLFAASPGKYQAPVHFFEFDGQNIAQVGDPPNEASMTGAARIGMVVLPTGQILMGSCDGGLLQIYTSSGSPDPSWLPVISSVPSTLVAGATYQISGRQFNGRTQGAFYGDDAQTATNYPLVRLANNATGHVFYARTFGHSTMSIAPDQPAATNFTLPPSGKIETGSSSLVVVANGIASQPVAVSVSSGTTYTLSISVVGTPGGKVTSSPTGIDCGSTCSASFAAGTQITLTATPANAWGLAGWGGACGGIGGCSVTMNANSSVSAAFTTLFMAAETPVVAFPADIPALLSPIVAPVPQ